MFEGRTIKFQIFDVIQNPFSELVAGPNKKTSSYQKRVTVKLYVILPFGLLDYMTVVPSILRLWQYRPEVYSKFNNTRKLLGIILPFYDVITISS